MAFAVQTWRDIMVMAANGASRAYDPLDSTVTDELSVNLKSKIAGYGNTAFQRLWKNPNPAFAWKWTTNSGLITLQTDGSMLWSDIEYSDDWFNVWSQDPRPNQNPSNLGWYVGNPAFPIMCAEDNSAIWPRIGGQTTVFAFWRTPVPRLTSRLVNTSTTYNTIGTLVWDESGTGSVYKSIATGALGSALTDTSKWTPQNIPDRLAEIMADWINAQLLAADGSDGSSSVADKGVQTWLDFEMSKENPRDGSGPVWAYDRRFQRSCSYWQW